jgi:hypothetical protein
MSDQVSLKEVLDFILARSRAYEANEKYQKAFAMNQLHKDLLDEFTKEWKVADEE